MNFNDNIVYFIVEFDESGKKCLDLVPRVWVTESEGKYFCRYPEKSQYGKLKKLVKGLREPEDNWGNYPVEIISEARKYMFKRSQFWFFNTFIIRKL